MLSADWKFSASFFFEAIPVIPLYLYLLRRMLMSLLSGLDYGFKFNYIKLTVL
jgi:hypothetical protein